MNDVKIANRHGKCKKRQSAPLQLETREGILFCRRESRNNRRTDKSLSNQRSYPCCTPAGRMQIMLFVAALGFAAPAAAQFEGVFETKNITTNQTGSIEEFTMTMWIKPDRVKVSSGSADAAWGTTMIYRADRGVIWMLNGEERTYAEIEQQSEPEQHRIEGGSGEFRIRKTGKKQKILGYPCEQVVITRSNEQTILWGSTRLKRLQETLASVLGTDRAATPAEWAAQVDRMGLFPLRSTTKISGRIVESQEVTRIQETELAADIFDLPAGYRKSDLDRLMDDASPR
jgi:hypothetical protein